MIHALFAALALSLAPVHGVVLAAVPGGDAIVRTDPITGVLPASTHRFHLAPRAAFASGTEIDAYLDRSTQPWTLREPEAAGAFAPGQPDPARVIPIELGSTLPAVELVTQDGTALQLDRAFAGKTLLLTFIFTRCPDRTLCPAISGKFAYLQSHLDPKRFALIEITLDPPYDSPAALQRYGAQYGANPAIWTMFTGKGSTVQHALNTFRISSMRVSAANFLHDDKLYIVSPQGRVAYVVETGDWDPDGVLAEARALSGLASNPFERFKLSLVASVVAICGGSQFAGIVLLELALFAFITAIVVTALWFVARTLWGRKGPNAGVR
jgi:cytochrome oxidase Cu insertion factor (SCO1/SenC/PrrC family)